MDTKEKALNDFNVIKEAINRTKKNSQWIKKSFLILGLMTTLLLCIQLVINLFVSNYSTIAVISPLSKLIVYLVTAFFLIRLANKEKRHTNTFFRVFISLFLLNYAVMPIILLLVRSFIVISNTGNAESLVLLQQMTEFLNIFIYSISLLLVSRINGNRMFYILSIMNIFVYLSLFVLNNSFSIHYMQMVSLQYSSLYSGLVTSLGYLILYYSMKDGNEQ